MCAFIPNLKDRVFPLENHKVLPFRGVQRLRMHVIDRARSNP